MTLGEWPQFMRLVGSMKRKGLKSDTARIVYVSDEFISKIVGTVIMPKIFVINIFPSHSEQSSEVEKTTSPVENFLFFMNLHELHSIEV